MLAGSAIYYPSEGTLKTVDDKQMKNKTGGFW